MPASAPDSAASSTWYCAAGTAAEADGFADHSVVMANPTDGDLEARVTVFAGAIAVSHVPDRPAGDARETALPAPVTERVELPAGESVVLRVADVVQAPLGAALVEIDGGGVAVEHRVSGPNGTDVAPCSTFAAPAWHLAWGATTRDAREIVVLFNPFPSDAIVDAVFATEGGVREPVRFQGLPVPARSVVGVDLGVDVTRSEQVSATFRARSGRIVVERLQHFDGSLGLAGLSLALGAPEAATTWVFAEGEASAPSPGPAGPDGRAGDDGTANADTASRAERIVVYNPGDDRAEVDVRLHPSAEEPAPLPQPFRLSIGPRGYEIVDYGGHERVVAGVPHATVVRSTNGRAVVAERVTVDTAAHRARGTAAASGSPRASEITASPGSRLAAGTWTFPPLGAGDGSVASLVVFNPDLRRAVEVRVDAGATVEVPPGGRVTLDVDPGVGSAARGMVVRGERAVVVDRVVTSPDGRRLALSPGVPAVDGAVLLDALADDGALG
jgi:hypothetical protein